MSNFNPLGVCYFARTNFRNDRQLFGIDNESFKQNIYVVGLSGCGKTSLLKVLMQESLLQKPPIAFTFYDLHGDAAKEIVAIMRQKFPKQPLIYFDASNPNIDWNYNVFRNVREHQYSLVTANILEIFHRKWKSAWGPKMENLLRMAILSLHYFPKADISDILKIISDKAYREANLRFIKNKIVADFWSKEFPKYKPHDLLPVTSKVTALLSHNIIKKILVDNKRPLSLRKIIDSGTVLICNFARGSLGSDAAEILSGLMLVSLSSAVYSRIDTPEEKRVPHRLFIDEFQLVAGANSGSANLIEELLSQSRKFSLSCCLCHQHLHQLPIEIRNAVLGCGTIICFRLNIHDASLMEKEFHPEFKAIDFTSLANYSIYLRLMIDGKPSKPFSADTIL